MAKDLCAGLMNRIIERPDTYKVNDTDKSVE